VKAELVSVEIAEEVLRELCEDACRVRRDVYVEALRELRDPRELVRAWRQDCPSDALDAALEVHRRAVSLERRGLTVG
jgi:hypothetical protein